MPQRPLNEMDCDRTRSQTKHGRHRHFGHRGRTQLHPNQQQLCPSNTFCVKHVYTVRRTIPTATALAWQRGDSQTWHLAHHASRVANHQRKSRPHLEDRSLCFLSCIMNIRQSTDGMAATRCSIGCRQSTRALHLLVSLHYITSLGHSRWTQRLKDVVRQCYHGDGNLENLYLRFCLNRNVTPGQLPSALRKRKCHHHCTSNAAHAMCLQGFVYQTPHSKCHTFSATATETLQTFHTRADSRFEFGLPGHVLALVQTEFVNLASQTSRDTYTLDLTSRLNVQTAGESFRQHLSSAHACEKTSLQTRLSGATPKPISHPQPPKNPHWSVSDGGGI